MNLKSIILGAVLLGFTMLSAAGCKPSSKTGPTSVSNEEAPKVGYFAPNFRLASLSGEEISLAGLRGKVVLINFWATWCTPCRAEMPSLEMLYSVFKDDDFEILAISNDVEGERVVRPFIQSLGLTYPILLDPDYRVDEKYLIQSVPTTFLVDRDGVITHQFIGWRNWDAPESHDLIKKLLKS